MMNPWIAQDLVSARRQDLERSASQSARRRQSAQPAASQSAQAGRSSRTYVARWAGEQLIRIGRRLAGPETLPSGT